MYKYILVVVIFLLLNSYCPSSSMVRTLISWVKNENSNFSSGLFRMYWLFFYKKIKNLG